MDFVAGDGLSFACRDSRFAAMTGRWRIWGTINETATTVDYSLRGAVWLDDDNEGNGLKIRLGYRSGANWDYTECAATIDRTFGVNSPYMDAGYINPVHGGNAYCAITPVASGSITKGDVSQTIQFTLAVDGVYLENASMLLNPFIGYGQYPLSYWDGETGCDYFYLRYTNSDDALFVELVDPNNSNVTIPNKYDKPDRPVITGSTLDTGTKFTANIDWKYTTSAPVYLATVYYYDEITNSTVAGWPSTSDSTEAGAGGTTAFAYRKAPSTPLRSEANGTMTYPSTGSWSFDQTRTARNPVGVVANAQAKSDGLYQDSNGWFTFFPAPVAPSGLSIAANGTYGATFNWTNNYMLSCYTTEIWSASSMSVSNGRLVKSADAVLLGTVAQGVSTFSKTDIWSTADGASTKTFYIAQKSSYDQWTNPDKANFVKSGKLDGVYTTLLTGTLSNGGATIYWYDANGARHLGVPYWYDANGTRHDVLGVYWYDSNGTRHDIIA